jgi:toxin ParE1/3/4
MSDYERIVAVDEDLINIARYTFESWGIDQAKRYAAKLEKHFQGIAQGSVHTRIFLKLRPKLRYSRSQYHVVFHLVRTNDTPLIIAVLHERMDLMARLKNRLP